MTIFNGNYKWKFLAGRIICFYGPFSIAMLNIQRVLFLVTGIRLNGRVCRIVVATLRSCYFGIIVDFFLIVFWIFKYPELVWLWLFLFLCFWFCIVFLLLLLDCYCCLIAFCTSRTSLSEPNMSQRFLTPTGADLISGDFSHVSATWFVHRTMADIPTSFGCWLLSAYYGLVEKNRHPQNTLVKISVFPMM